MRTMLWLGLGMLAAGCGPRGEVAKRQALERIDELLGKMEVQRQEIEDGMAAVEKAANDIRKAKIKAQVKLEQLDERVRPYRERQAECDATLARVRDLLTADTAAVVGTREYTPAELRDMAGKVIDARKRAEAQVRQFDTARASLHKVVDDLGRRQEELERRVATLKGRVAALDAEMAAARAMKDASGSIGGGDGTLDTSLDELEDKVAGLTGDVRAELMSEDERWQPGTTDGSINEVDAFLRNAGRPSDTVAEIDAILGRN